MHGVDNREPVYLGQQWAAEKKQLTDAAPRNGRQWRETGVLGI